MHEMFPKLMYFGAGWISLMLNWRSTSMFSENMLV